MKMKEVCALTGLTERTIRFYAEKGLVMPKTSRQNGRKYSDYSTADVDCLRTVAVLRRMLFSIDKISRIRTKPAEIPEIIAEYRTRIAEEAEIRAEVLALDADALSRCKSIAELGRAMSVPAARRRLPETDISPDFARFEPELPEDKEAAYRQFLQKQLQMEHCGFIIIAAIAALNVVASIFSLIQGNSTIFMLIMQIVCSLALLSGQTWARVLFLIGLILSAGVNIQLLFTIVFANYPPSIVIFCLIEIVLNVVFAVALLVSKSVKEYLYRQKNG